MARGRSSRAPAGPWGTSFYSLDSRYAMLFRERRLAAAADIGESIARMEANLTRLRTRIRELESSGGSAQRLAELRAAEARLRASVEQRTAEARGEAQSLIDDWFGGQPGQRVVVEVELQPGALEHILNRSVLESNISRYPNENVYIYKFERGYGHNIAVPHWQRSLFNRLVRAVRLYATRSPFGPEGLAPSGSQTSIAPSGLQ